MKFYFIIVVMYLKELKMDNARPLFEGVTSFMDGINLSKVTRIMAIISDVVLTIQTILFPALRPARPKIKDPICSQFHQLFTNSFFADFPFIA